MKSLEQELRDGNYDIHDVLNDETSERRVFLARMGRDVEALAGTLESDVLVALIENGYAEDYYDDWCFHASSNVRKALASKGYYPERFIHDPSSVVRMAVIDAHPDMVTELLRDGNTENWRHIYDRVLEKREPKVIQQFVNNPIDTCHHTRYYDTICEYAMALNIELTPFEATMSPEGLVVKAIEYFYDAENQLNNYGARPDEYIGEYVEDCTNGMSYIEALQKQQRKYGVY